MSREINVHIVPRFWFKIRMLRLDPTIRSEIKNCMYFESDLIDAYGFGRVPHHRIYRIFLTDGAIYEWDVTR
jgi:hypothetical protein